MHRPFDIQHSSELLAPSNVEHRPMFNIQYIDCVSIHNNNQKTGSSRQKKKPQKKISAKKKRLVQTLRVMRA